MQQFGRIKRTAMKKMVFQLPKYYGQDFLKNFPLLFTPSMIIQVSGKSPILAEKGRFSGNTAEK